MKLVKFVNKQDQQAEQMLNNALAPMNFQAIGVQVYEVDVNNPQGAQLAQQYQVQKVPTMILFDPQEQPIDAVAGVPDTRVFASRVMEKLQERGLLNMQQQQPQQGVMMPVQQQPMMPQQQQQSFQQPMPNLSGLQKIQGQVSALQSLQNKNGMFGRSF